MTTDQRIADIALFFSDDQGQERRCWITEKMYTDDKYLLGDTPAEWFGTVVNQVGKDPYYVTNLSNLDPPGDPPGDSETHAAAKPAPAKKPAKSAPTKPGDLVVIPFSDPDHAYRIPKSVYEKLPQIDDITGADLRFMANTQGVVLANIPKVDLAGMTCYLLNLRALRKPAKP
jgi:hypothetical protein